MVHRRCCATFESTPVDQVVSVICFLRGMKRNVGAQIAIFEPRVRCTSKMLIVNIMTFQGRLVGLLEEVLYTQNNRSSALS